MALRINWVGLAAGVLTFVALGVSLYQPWWTLIVGQNLVKIDASPVLMNFGLFGSSFTIPLVWALNLITILTFTASGAVMLVYSFVPSKPYAKHLLGFSWKKPVYSVVGFAATLLIALVIAGHFGMYFPLNKSATITLPTNWTNGATVSMNVSASFGLAFYLAAAAAALCILAKVLHGFFAHVPAAPEKAAVPPTPAAPASPAAPAPLNS